MGYTEALRRIKILLPIVPGQEQRVEKELCRPENALYREMVKLRGYFVDITPLASNSPEAVAQDVWRLLGGALPKPENRAYGVPDGVPLELPRWPQQLVWSDSDPQWCRSLHIQMSGYESVFNTSGLLTAMKSMFKLFDTQGTQGRSQGRLPSLAKI